MARFIDVDELKKRMCNECFGGNCGYRCYEWSLMNDAPTVDPVKHGHWTIEDIITYERSYGGTLYEPVYKCSCCGRVTESYVRGDEPIMPEDADFPKFCGNCGARMDEVEDGEID